MYLATQISTGRTFKVNEDGKKAIEQNPQLEGKYRFSPIAKKGKEPIEVKKKKTGENSPKE